MASPLHNDKETVDYPAEAAPDPQPYHLSTGEDYCSCGRHASSPMHDAQSVAAWSLVRIADTLDRVSKIEVGGLAGMLFGGGRK